MGKAEHPGQAALEGDGFSPDGRQFLAARLAPLTGAQAALVRQAGRQADEFWRALADQAGERAVYRAGLDAVRSAAAACRRGSNISDRRHAWLAGALTDVRVRDYAMAHITAEFAAAHTRLWAEAVRRAQPGQVAAPATLLAYAAIQDGQGELAGLALDRALADDPGYGMARLLRKALETGVSPKDFAGVMTPAEILVVNERRLAAEAGQ